MINRTTMLTVLAASSTFAPPARCTVKGAGSWPCISIKAIFPTG